MRRRRRRQKEREGDEVVCTCTLRSIRSVQFKLVWFDWYTRTRAQHWTELIQINAKDTNSIQTNPTLIPTYFCNPRPYPGGRVPQVSEHRPGGGVLGSKSFRTWDNTGVPAEEVDYDVGGSNITQCTVHGIHACPSRPPGRQAAPLHPDHRPAPCFACWRRVLHASTRGVGTEKMVVRWPDPPHGTVDPDPGLSQPHWVGLSPSRWSSG
eukprot:gene8814-biopygen3160